MKKKIPAVIIVLIITFTLFGCAAAEQPTPAAVTQAAPAAQSAMPSSEQTNTPASSPSAAPTQPAKMVSGTDKFSFDYNGVERTYVLHIPKELQPGAPLVFVLHGYGSTAVDMMLNTGMDSRADEYGFAAVFPQGLPGRYEKDGYCWNADLTLTDTDDLGFLVALAEYLQQTYNLSAQQTFATGMSNGGFMCYKLACDAPETFRAVASVSGTMSGNTWKARDKSVSVPILQIHGAADTVVPIDGTMNVSGGWGGAPAIREIIEYWADADGARDLETVKISDNVTAYRYSSSDNDNLVWYYEIAGHGHSWPKETDAGINASDVIWEFFSNYVE